MTEKDKTKIVKNLLSAIPPILTVEEDSKGDYYLSGLYQSNEKTEDRLLVEINTRIIPLLEKNKILPSDIFCLKNAEKFFITYENKTGEIIKFEKLEYDDSRIYDMVEDLDVFFEQERDERTELLKQNAVENEKILLNLYLDNEDFEINKTLRHWVFRTFLPSVNRIVMKMMNYTYRDMDEKAEFAVANGSLDFSIKLPSSKNLFNESPDYLKFSIIQNLLSCKSSAELTEIIKSIKDESLLFDYSKILTVLSSNNAWVKTTLVSPEGKSIQKRISGWEAAGMSVILKQTLEDTIKEETIEGVFLALDAEASDRKAPKFSIISIDKNKYSGIIDEKLAEELRNKKVNFLNDIYEFKVSIHVENLSGENRQKITRKLMAYKDTGKKVKQDELFPQR